MTLAFDRNQALARMAAETFDVVIIGGGVTGAGVALDAGARGLRTALVEGRDFASGTSSKSSKLVHGGLRYLQQREYRLVYENLAERQRLLNNAPHLVQPLPFLIPLFGKDGVANKTVAKAYSTVLWLYDVTGGWRIGKRHKRITRQEALAHLPTLRSDLVAAAFVYYDARTDDARLTLELMRTAVLDHGAVAANYAPVTTILKDGADAAGVQLADGTEVRARSVVNAAGVWSDDVRALDEGTHPDSIRPAKGIHLTVPATRMPADIAAVIPVPKDHRSIFVIPWGEQTYLGTTDTDYDASLDDPQCTPDDVAYILNAVNTFVTEPLNPSDVTGTWAGLRPLVKAAKTERTADLSRRHTVATSPSGVVSITGGKLTTYRKMAADTVDVVVRRLGTGPRRSPTAKLRLRGAGPRPPGVDDHLFGRYGTEAGQITDLVTADPLLGDPLIVGLPYLRAEAVYAVRHEMARTLEDVLSRRTRALLRERDATMDAAEQVAGLLAAELGWDATEIGAQVAAFRALAARERETAGLPLSALPDPEA
jgi:glycerol-3-phosphate dehydrogenase